MFNFLLRAFFLLPSLITFSFFNNVYCKPARYSTNHDYYHEGTKAVDLIFHYAIAHQLHNQKEIAALEKKIYSIRMPNSISQDVQQKANKKFSANKSAANQFIRGRRDRLKTIAIKKMIKDAHLNETQSAIILALYYSILYDYYDKEVGSDFFKPMIYKIFMPDIEKVEKEMKSTGEEAKKYGINVDEFGAAIVYGFAYCSAYCAVKEMGSTMDPHYVGKIARDFLKFGNKLDATKCFRFINSTN